ncbi:hypothetical protein FRC03_004891, partial [Tulasnella sp. 419]
MAATYTHDKLNLLSFSSNNTLRTWDPISGVLVEEPIGPLCQEDAETLLDATMIDNCSPPIRLRFLRSLQFFRNAKTLSCATVIAICSSPTSLQIAMGGVKGGLSLWEKGVDSMVARKLWERKFEYQVPATLSHDKTLFAFGSGKDILVYDAVTGLRMRRLEGHTPDVISVSFSHDGSKIVSGYLDGTICIWQVFTGDQLLRLENYLPTSLHHVAFSHNTLHIVATCNHSIHIYNASTGSLLQQWDVSEQQDLEHFAFFSNDDQQIICASNKRLDSYTVWEAETGSYVKKLDKVPNDVFLIYRCNILTFGEQIIHIWNSFSVGGDNEIIRRGNGHDGMIQSIVFSHDNTKIASGSEDCTICLWCAVTGCLIREFQGHAGGVNAVSFSSDSLLIVSGSFDKTVCIWSTSTGSMLQRLEGHDTGLLSVSFSHNNLYVVAGSQDSTICIWNVENGCLQRQLDAHTKENYFVAFSHDDTLVASGSVDCIVCIWDLHSGNLIKMLNKGRGYDQIKSMMFSPDGSQILCISGNGIFIWDTQPQSNILDADSERWSVQIAVSADGSQIAAFSEHAIYIWSDLTETLIEKHHGYSVHEVISARFCYHDTYVIMEYRQDGYFYQCLWDVVDGTLVNKWTQFHGESSNTFQALTVAFAHQSLLMADVIHRDFRNLTITSFSHSEGDTYKFTTTLAKISESLCSIAYSYDDLYLLLGYEDGTLATQDLNNKAFGSGLKNWRGHHDKINAVAFSRDHSYAVSGSNDKTICIWNTVTGSLDKTLVGHTDMVTSVAIFKNNIWIISGSWDSTICIWNVHTGMNFATLHHDGSHITGVAISPNGSHIAAASESSSNDICIWDTQTWTLTKKLKGHQASTTSVAFSPNGLYVASGSLDRTICMWNVQDWSRVFQISRQYDSINCISFSYDSKFLASASRDGSVCVWDVEAGSLTHKQGTAGNLYSSYRPFVKSPDPVANVPFAPRSSVISSSRGTEIVQLKQLQQIGRWIVVETSAEAPTKLCYLP